METWHILTVLVLLFVVYNYSGGNTVEHLAIQKVLRGLAKPSQSFSQFNSTCEGGEGLMKTTAYSPVSTSAGTAAIVDPVWGKPDSVEFINGRFAPVWIRPNPTCPIDGVDGDYGAF